MATKLNGKARASLPRLLSVKAVSEATTIPASTIYMLVADGTLPAVRITESAIRLDEAVVSLDRFAPGGSEVTRLRILYHALRLWATLPQLTWREAIAWARSWRR